MNIKVINNRAQTLCNKIESLYKCNASFYIWKNTEKIEFSFHFDNFNVYKEDGIESFMHYPEDIIHHEYETTINFYIVNHYRKDR
jgi:hypothetical protein